MLGAGSGPEGLGNGAAIACTYAAAGATVVAACVDVTSGAGLVALATEVTAEHGHVDVLHNNVGVSRLGSPPDLSEEDWRLVLDTNLTGAFLACRAFLPVMRAAGRGSVVNTSSVAGEVHTGYDYSAYYAAKAGLNHFTRTLAVQLAPDGLRVNAVLPGMIDTPLVHRQLSGAHASALPTAGAWSVRDRDFCTSINEKPDLGSILWTHAALAHATAPSGGRLGRRSLLGCGRRRGWGVVSCPLRPSVPTSCRVSSAAGAWARCTGPSTATSRGSSR